MQSKSWTDALLTKCSGNIFRKWKARSTMRGFISKIHVKIKADTADEIKNKKLNGFLRNKIKSSVLS
ncbi:hypothetical protein B5E53_08345 [Eubacterium sp. An11]|nr:hypothetical protein B5E53_08345 [Eubacterium sp. An11]